MGSMNHFSQGGETFETVRRPRVACAVAIAHCAGNGVPWGCCLSGDAVGQVSTSSGNIAHQHKSSTWSLRCHTIESVWQICWQQNRPLPQHLVVQAVLVALMVPVSWCEFATQPLQPEPLGHGAPMHLHFSMRNTKSIFRRFATTMLNFVMVHHTLKGTLAA